MRNWNPSTGFEGTLHELFELMAAFYPRQSTVIEVQRWLLAHAASGDETFICRRHAGTLRGAWIPRAGANAYLTSDNEFATSVFGLTWSGEVERLTSGSLLDALTIRGVKLCWALGTTPEEASVVVRSHATSGLALQAPVGGTSLYRPRGEQRLKLAHLTPAAEAIGALDLDELTRRRLRMFRSVNPMNMYPLPRAGKQFTHSASWKGARLALMKNDIGETDELLECLVAFLEEKYRHEGHAGDFATYANAARLALESLDLPALRQKSREVHVTITPTRNLDRSPLLHSRVDVMSYEKFKEWALDIVRRHGHAPIDVFACEQPCNKPLKGGRRAARLHPA